MHSSRHAPPGRLSRSCGSVSRGSPKGTAPSTRRAPRFRILELRSLFAWNAKETAQRFLVCTNTILNWEGKVDEDAKAVGSTVKPTPPIRRYADVVRSLAQTMVRLDCGGEDTVAAMLARAGWKLSPRSVRRFAKQKTAPPPLSPPPASKPTNPVVARFVNHVWMVDVTVVKTFLGLRQLHVASVFDAFSRVPLVVQTLDKKPKAAQMARLLSLAVKAFGKPKYLITDKGKEFTGKAFKKAVRRLGIVHRLGSVQNIFATARLEHFWRALKDTASLRSRIPLTREDLERRLETTLSYYLLFRPHQGLEGATPAEAFLGLEPACSKAVSPPRGAPGEGPTSAPFTIEYLAPAERQFPILIAA